MMSIDDYISDFIAKTIARKKADGISPVCCTQTEIIRHLQDVVLLAMRSLHEKGLYRGAINKDKVPMLIDLDNGRFDV